MDISKYKLPSKTKSNPRQYLISQFVEALNKERKGKYDPVSFPRIAKELKHLNVAELEAFISECMDYKRRNGSFGKWYFSQLKIKK